jgi:hypothetical protein
MTSIKRAVLQLATVVAFSISAFTHTVVDTETDENGIFLAGQDH